MLKGKPKSFGTPGHIQQPHALWGNSSSGRRIEAAIQLLNPRCQFSCKLLLEPFVSLCLAVLTTLSISPSEDTKMALLLFLKGKWHKGRPLRLDPRGSL